MLSVDVVQLEGSPLLIMAGRLDGMGAGIFDAAVASVHEVDDGPVLLAMEAVDYLSSAGLRSLMQLAKACAKRQARVWIISLQPSVRRVFGMAGLLDQFELIESRETASERLRLQSASLAQNQTITIEGRDHLLSPLSASESRLERLSISPVPKLECLALDELGFSIGIGGLGNTREQASEATGAFISTGRMVCVRPLDGDHTIPDFMVTDHPSEVPVYVASGWRLSGEPVAVLSSIDGEFSLGDLIHTFSKLLKKTLDYPTTTIAWVMSAMDTDEDGWVGMGVLPEDGNWQMEAVRVHGPAPNTDSTCLDGYLQSVLRDDTLVGAFAPASSCRVSRYIAWFYAPAEAIAVLKRRVDVVFEDELEPPEEWDWIVRRIYDDAGAVRLRRLCGGFSAATFHVESVDREGRRLLPTVLKLADPAFSEREDLAYELYVRKYILNNSAIRMGRCARNGWVGLHYNFLGITGPESRLNWIGEHLVNRPLSETLPLFQTLFEKILNPWYGQARPSAIAPYREHNPTVLFPTLVDEAQAVLGISADQPYIACPPLGRDLPNPYFLLQHVYDARSSVEWPGMTSVVHGDLNLNNVLLDEKENIYVIDFSETHMGDLCSDFSRIEPLLLLQMTRLRDADDMAALLRYLHAVFQPASLFNPPCVYDGEDPLMDKAHGLVRLLRAEVKQLSGERLHPVPYLLGLLRWALPIVVFRQLPLLNKQFSCYASALLTEALLEADPEAAVYFTLPTA